VSLNASLRSRLNLSVSEPMFCWRSPRWPFGPWRATTTIPIVIVSVRDSIDASLVASLARPDGNITAVSGRVLELNETWDSKTEMGLAPILQQPVDDGTAVAHILVASFHSCWPLGRSQRLDWSPGLDDGTRAAANH
jgi:hypothetical protein